MTGREDLQLAVALGYFVIRDESIDDVVIRGNRLMWNPKLPDVLRLPATCRALRIETLKNRPAPSR